MAILDRSAGMLIARPDAVYGQGTEAWLPLDGRANAWRRLQDSGARLIDFREGVWCGTSLVWLLRVGRRCGHPARRSQARGAPQPRRLPRSTARDGICIARRRAGRDLLRHAMAALPVRTMNP